MEALFLEAAGRLVGAAPRQLSAQKGADLEALAFDWLLGAEANLQYPDPYHHKDRVRDACIWGWDMHLGAVTCWGCGDACSGKCCLCCC